MTDEMKPQFDDVAQPKDEGPNAEMPSSFGLAPSGGSEGAATAAYGLTFSQVVAITAQEEQLVSEWDRLTGYRLRSLKRRSPIERMVDEATGYRDEKSREIARDFVRFVYDCVWTRLPK